MRSSKATHQYESKTVFKDKGMYLFLDQLQSIKKVRLSRIICDVGENVTSIQPMVMLQHTLEGNNRVSCGSLPRLDLRPFQEKEYGFGDALKNGRNNEEGNTKLSTCLKNIYYHKYCNTFFYI